MNPIDYYFSFVDYLAAFPWSTYIFVLKVIAFIITVTAAWWYFSTVRKLTKLAATPVSADDITETSLPREIVAKPWLEIQEKMASSSPADWSIAVIQADAIMDQLLKASGYIGDTMGDRLKQVNTAELNAIDDIWRAHKLRNRLAHGTGGALTRREAEEAIRGYERAFRELNYID
jgi:hypothetical protein